MKYKGYNVVPLGTFPMVEIKQEGQGTVPEALRGFFTTVLSANKAIDMYLETLKRGRKNGSPKDGSTD